MADKRLRALLLLFFGWVMLKNAWLCEDAFITYRVVDNFLHGHGLRWNTLERVQVYTHPLWMLLVATATVPLRNVQVAAMVMSIACSLAAVGHLFFRVLRTPLQCIVAAIVLTFSKAFMDFSTGGLENPLSHLLLVLFLGEYLREREERRFEWLVLFTGLALVNRMDLVWLFLPALLEAARAGGYLAPNKIVAWRGLLPFFAWELFALVYYGFAFPNSAYAKLTAGVDRSDVLMQGASFFVNSLAWDPLTLFAITALVLFAATRSREDRSGAAVALGIGLHLLYLLGVGGDYMSGRPLTSALLAGVALLSRIEFEAPLEYLPAMAIPLALGVTAPRPPILTNDHYVSLESSPQSVDDERGYRHRDTSLLLLNKDHGLKDQGGWIADGIAARAQGRHVVVYKNIGYFAYFAGPEVHVIDPYGIGDPLMARTPFPKERRWSSGHFFRDVPGGYTEAAMDQGSLDDPALQAYWAKLEFVTRGPIWSSERLAEVMRFALGRNPNPTAP